MVRDPDSLATAMGSFYNLFTLTKDIPEVGFSVPYQDDWDRSKYLQILYLEIHSYLGHIL